jgi:hypothetical protein
MIKNYKKFITEGADWILLRSGNVAIDSWNLSFMPLKNGLPDLSIPSIEQDDPEYDEIVNKLNDEDKETYLALAMI